ncbi:MAG: LuxR family transcriptional regulator [Pseudomonadota bacterium]
MPSLEDFIKDTQDCDSEEALFGALTPFLKSHNIDYFAYFILAQNLRALPPRTGLVTFNYPRDMADLYFENNYVAIDPIIAQSLKESRPFHWSHAKDVQSLNAQQQQMFDDYAAANFIDGLSVPVYGPMGTIALFSLSSRGAKLDVSDEDLQAIQYACVQVHTRYFDLANINTEPPTKRLSPREKEALILVADGLANPAIAEQLGVTENTVDTMLRRIFIKLDVNNRISAVLKAIGSGVIVP